jgi:hypothetical protein
MRRLLVLVTIAGLATGSAEAASAAVPVLLRTPGAEQVELRDGNGRAVIARRGVLLVTVGSGKLRIVDLPGGERPNLNRRCQDRARRVRPNAVEVTGTNIRCQIWSGQNGGPWQVVIRGRRISASGIVRGSLTLDAVNRGPVGQYRIAGESWKRWPREARTFSLNRK